MWKEHDSCNDALSSLIPWLSKTSFEDVDGKKYFKHEATLKLYQILAHAERRKIPHFLSKLSVAGWFPTWNCGFSLKVFVLHEVLLKLAIWQLRGGCLAQVFLWKTFSRSPEFNPISGKHGRLLTVKQSWSFGLWEGGPFSTSREVLRSCLTFAKRWRAAKSMDFHFFGFTWVCWNSEFKILYFSVPASSTPDRLQKSFSRVFLWSCLCNSWVFKHFR